MANYPDWVLAHKNKGMYINKVGDKYYLYAAHSERIKGTDKIKRICDARIQGTIDYPLSEMLVCVLSENHLVGTTRRDLVKCLRTK